MTDLKKIFPNSTIGEGKITITDQEVKDLIEKWKAIDAERDKKRRKVKNSWGKIKDRIVN